jgi:hypothetical protein
LVRSRRKDPRSEHIFVSDSRLLRALPLLGKNQNQHRPVTVRCLGRNRHRNRIGLPEGSGRDDRSDFHRTGIGTSPVNSQTPLRSRTCGDEFPAMTRIRSLPRRLPCHLRRFRVPSVILPRSQLLVWCADILRPPSVGMHMEASRLSPMACTKTILFLVKQNCIAYSELSGSRGGHCEEGFVHLLAWRCRVMRCAAKIE